MKSNKGVALISLIIYIIVLVIVIAIISVLTKNFYSNVNETTLSNNGSEQYSKFIEYLTKDVNTSRFIKCNCK